MILRVQQEPLDNDVHGRRCRDDDLVDGDIVDIIRKVEVVLARAPLAGPVEARWRGSATPRMSD